MVLAFLSEAPLLAFALVLAASVASLSAAATMLGVLGHREANQYWGVEMNGVVGDLRGVTEDLQPLLDTLLGLEPDQPRTNEDRARAWQSATAETRSQVEALMTRTSRDIDDRLRKLDDMPISSLAEVHDHADEIARLIDDFVAVRQVVLD